MLAIYPRIELLRDQFAEAYREARRLDGFATFGRPVRIAALYGGTPQNANQVHWRWKSTGDGWACPYMPCPTCGQTKLIWSDQQIAAGVEQLTCTACSAQVPRRAPRAHPQADAEQPARHPLRHYRDAQPDDARRRHAPVDRRRARRDADRPGAARRCSTPTRASTGAQVAGLLKRWRHAHRRPVHFVGLSATLRRAGEFFADITGLSPHQIVVIEPGPQDIEYDGQEYMVAVRSDPASGASVLSTTIQTAMLMQRALDPIEVSTSEGAIGQRLFAFTDDLDVTNRLFFDLRTRRDSELRSTGEAVARGAPCRHRSGGPGAPCRWPNVGAAGSG